MLSRAHNVVRSEEGKAVVLAVHSCDLSLLVVQQLLDEYPKVFMVGS